MEERYRGPAEAPNEGQPTEPRPAASIVLLRGGGRHSSRGLEVLLMKRTGKAAFMPNVWVFPGGSVEEADGDGEEGRRACARRELAEEAAIELDPAAELVLFCRWITPELITTRFDAWFFLAMAPPHAPPKPDGVEMVDAAWYPPQAALDAAREGDIVLAFPTIRQLEWLQPFGTAEEALSAHRGRRIDPILPRVVGEAGGNRVVLPGDPDYPD
jgi:8-oxo-dGTP pyrophosphatase MutT (NUDIX family)